MDTLIKNGVFALHDELVSGDLRIEAGVIQDLGRAITPKPGQKVLDARGALIAPGLVDIHVHLREPGFTAKETIKSGSLAAARGGFTTVCAMPNLSPAPETPALFKEQTARNQKDGVVHVLQYAPITLGLRSEELTEMSALAQAGAFAFTNDGVGVQTAGVMYQAMKRAAALGKAIVAHTEDDSLLFGGVMHEGQKNKTLGLPGILSVAESSQIARDVLLAEATGVHYHVCHVSAKESVAVIRAAKQAGIHVTAEVTPHHLLLNEEDIPRDHGFWKMNPPLRGKADQEALIAGLLDGTIDCIATDHAPHTAAEKEQSMRKAAFGIVGSETAFSLLYTKFVKTKIFTLEQLLHWLSSAPSDLFGLDRGRLILGKSADLTLFDLAQEDTIDPAKFLSKGRNTPFGGKTVYGRTLATFVGGRQVYGGE